MLPSFTSLAISTKTRKHGMPIDMKRPREEGALPVAPEHIIETFVKEYTLAYNEIRKADLATSPRSVVQENYMSRIKQATKDSAAAARLEYDSQMEQSKIEREQSGQAVSDLQKSIAAKKEAERVINDIRMRGAYYKSEAGKAARKADPSLKMTDNQKREEYNRLETAKASIAELETHIQNLQKRLIDLQNMNIKRTQTMSELRKTINQVDKPINMLYDVMDWVKSPYNQSLWEHMKNGLDDLCGVWTDYDPDYFNADFLFDLTVAPWDNRSFKIYGLAWLQDLVFQRKLLSMLPKPKITISTNGPRITFGSDKKTFKSGVAALEVAIAIKIATRRVRQLYDGRPVAKTPDMTVVQNLVGWDVPLGLDNMPLSLMQSFQTLQTNAHPGSFVHELIDRVIQNDGYTRKLAILINTGDTGARARVARHSCVEFGLTGQTCSTITHTITRIKESSSMFLSTLYPRSIDVRKNRRDLIEDFQMDNAKVALIAWGGHARVIFKIGNGCAIVDPWKAAEKVRPPTAIRDVFGSEPEWIDREPEQCGEKSCSIIAMTRAVIIAIVASNGDDPDALRAAAKSELLDQTVHGPIAVMLVRCAHMIVTPSPYPQKEVF